MRLSVERAVLFAATTPRPHYSHPGYAGVHATAHCKQLDDKYFLGLLQTTSSLHPRGIFLVTRCLQTCAMLN